MLMYIWLIVGFLLLVKGADFFVEGSSSVAKNLRVPSIIIGLTIVAFGTSCPEAAVSITASMQNKNAMALSNVVGSNIFNLLVVVGASACIKPIKVDTGMLKREYPFSIIVAAILLLVSADVWVRGDGRSNVVGRFAGLFLLLLFIGFVIYMVFSALKNRTAEEEDLKVLSMPKSIIFIIGGMIAIIIGGQLVVNSATDIARQFGLSETLIGLTIVALGTSLPELVTSMVAARKGESDLALGNVVGSNIFNILLVLGASAVLSPVEVGIASIYDIILLIVFSIFVYLLCFTRKKVGRVEGLAMLAAYAGYMIYIIQR